MGDEQVNNCGPANLPRALPGIEHAVEEPTRLAPLHSSDAPRGSLPRAPCRDGSAVLSGARRARQARGIPETVAVY